MPVLINRDSGLAEDLSADLAQQAIQSTHDVPLNDPEGSPVQAPYEELGRLLSEGFSQPSSEQLQSLIDTATAYDPAELAKTFAQGAGSGATFGLSVGAQRLAGDAPEDIQRRMEVNPYGLHTIGEIAGIGGSMLTGVGAGALAAKAGTKLGEKLASKAAASAAGRIGSAAAVAAAENAMIGAGGEVGRMFAGDPEQSIETAAANIGMSGLLGAGLGAGFKGTGELWALGPGKKVKSVMDMLKNKSEGLPSDMKALAAIDIAPERHAAISGNPAAARAFQLLQEISTSSGQKAQTILKEFNDNIRMGTIETFGKAPGQIAELANLSKAETGHELQKILSKQIDDEIGPIAKQYDKLTEKFSSTTVPELDKIRLQNQIAEYITAQGLEKGANEAGLKLAQKALNQVKLQDTAKDLRNYVQSLYDAAPWGSETYQVGKQLRGIFNDTLENTIGQVAGAEYQAVKGAYGQFKNFLGELNDRLKLGRDATSGANSFIKALKEADPESIANRLSVRGDTNLQALLMSDMPNINAIIRSNEVNKLLKSSLGPDGELNPKKLFNNFNKLEPEMKSYMLAPENKARLEAIEELMRALPERMNPSGTAKTLDALWDEISESAAAVIATLAGGSPIAGYLLGKVSKWVGREGPDAMRLAMFKYLGGKGNVSAQGLKATVQVAEQVIKGEKALDKSVKAAVGLADTKAPKVETAALRKQVDELAASPEQLLNAENHTAAYIPEHGAAIGTAAGRVVSYLSTIRPTSEQLGILDAPKVASKTEEARYEQALQIAENPLTVLQSVKAGTLTLQELQHLNQMYPALYARMQQKLGQELIIAVDKGHKIPYHTQNSLSMFLGQPLNSSTLPLHIQATQMSFAPKQAPQEAMGAKTRSVPNSKLPKMFATPNQTREFRRAK